jgi:hypothetical protein
VFVHGLHGDHAPWTSEANVFWPEKLLPAKVSDACILSFEYEAAIGSFFDDDDGITDISNDLINELMDHRTEKDKVSQPRSPTARLIYKVDRGEGRTTDHFCCALSRWHGFGERTYPFALSVCLYMY